MYTVIYVSSAVELFPEGELEKLLEKARLNNHSLGVTGMLLYKDGNFMQMLEGPKEAVLGLLVKIEADPRHRGILRLLQQERTEREFSDWAMGFKRLESKSAGELPGHSDFLDLPLNSEEFLQNPSKSLKLLLNFKKIIR
jgi:hypothetical protein